MKLSKSALRLLLGGGMREDLRLADVMSHNVRFRAGGYQRWIGVTCRDRLLRQPPTGAPGFQGAWIADWALTRCQQSVGCSSFVPLYRAPSSAIKRLPLLDGHSIPQLAFGSGTAFYTKDAEQAIITSLEHGIFHIDTAQVYLNEDSVGAGLTAVGVPREQLYITTKLYKLEPGESVAESLQGSLKKLQLSYVDLFLIHSPAVFPEEGRLEEVWKEMEEAKDKGLTKSIGVSKFEIVDYERVLKVAKYKPVVNQIEYHPYVHKTLLPLIEYQQQQGIITEAYGGLAALVRYPDGPVNVLLSELAARIGNGATAGQLMLRWLEAKGVVTVTTSTKKERLVEYLGAYALPELTKEEITAIDNAGAKVYWSRYKKD